MKEEPKSPGALKASFRPVASKSSPPAESPLTSTVSCNPFVSYRVPYFLGSFPNFVQAGARKQCFISSDWLKCGTLPKGEGVGEGVRVHRGPVVSLL